MKNYNPAAFALAVSLLSKVEALVSDTLKEQGVNREQDEKAYFQATRNLYRALVACATQRMLDDGATPQFVFERTGSSVQTGFELFLERHPEVKAKLEAEMAAAKENSLPTT